MEKVKAGFVDGRKLLEEMKNAEPFMVIGGAMRGGKQYAMQKLQREGERMEYKGFVEMTDELLADSEETFSKMLAKEVDKMLLEGVERGEIHFDMCRVADMVHENAVAHGWWEGERDVDEVKALIHSEWSEAMEEARAGRPMEWYMCRMAIPEYSACTEKTECPWREHVGIDKCPVRCKKPEGIAVELIDGVIRILDYMASQYDDPDCVEWSDFKECMKTAGREVYLVYEKNVKDMKVPKLVNALHDFTSAALDGQIAANFGIVVGAVFEWIRAQGLSPEAIMLRKHEYNVTRPYKHGKKF